VAKLSPLFSRSAHAGHERRRVSRTSHHAFPRSQTRLLTAYADTDAAIKAINSIRLDHYLLKPWDPPEENLYPVLNDVLDDWQAGYRPPFEGIRVLGNRWSSDSHRVKDFLARHQFPYEWMDIEADREACSIYTDGKPQLPLGVLPDGARLENPLLPDLAERVGCRHALNRRSTIF
jgi:thioredoxin reductase (NADPH)